MAQKPYKGEKILKRHKKECSKQMEAEMETVYKFCKSKKQDIATNQTFFGTLDCLIENSPLYNLSLSKEEELFIVAHLEELCIREINEASKVIGSLNAIHKLAPSAEDKCVPVKKRMSYKALIEEESFCPVWFGYSNEIAPPLCGAIPPSPEDITKHLKPGHLVVAYVEAIISNETEEEFKISKNWILAELIKINENECIITDIDEVEKSVYTVDIEEIVPLPVFKANPELNPEAFFPKGSFVLAPTEFTNCFYPALVVDVPKTTNDTYSLRFTDETEKLMFGPIVQVPQTYVVQYKKLSLCLNLCT